MHYATLWQSVMSPHVHCSLLVLSLFLYQYYHGHMLPNKWLGGTREIFGEEGNVPFSAGTLRAKQSNLSIKGAYVCVCIHMV